MSAEADRWAQRREAFAEYLGLRDERRVDDDVWRLVGLASPALIFAFAAHDAFGSRLVAVAVGVLAGAPAILEAVRRARRAPRHAGAEGVAYALSLLGIFPVVLHWLHPASSFGRGLLIAVIVVAAAGLAERLVHLARRDASPSRAGR